MKFNLTGLPTRVFVGTALIALAVLAASLVATTATMRRSAEAAARRRLEQDADFIAHLLAGRERSLAGGARVFAQPSNFRAIVAKPNTPPEDMFDRAVEAAQLLDASWVFITDARGRVLAKSDEPSAIGADFGSVPLVAGALRGQTMSGFGVSRDSLLFQAVAVPIPGPSIVPVGVLVATRVVDAEVLRDARATTGSEVLFYALGADGRARVTQSSLARVASVDSALDAVIGARPTTSAAPRASMVTIGGTRYHAQGATATTAGGDAVGGWFVLRAHDGEPASVSGMRDALVAAALVGLALAMGAATLAARRVTRPIRALADAARKAADVPELDADSTDEIAALGSAFHAVLADLRDREALTALGPLGTLAATAAPASEPALDATAARPVTRGALRLDPRTVPNAPAFAPPRQRLADRYELEAVVGSGGTGLVWRARDLALGEVVAVKTLRAELLAADPLARERLTHEIRLARRLSHRNVVRIHDFAEHDGVPFLTMEYVDGPSLASMLRARGGLPARAVLAVAKQLLRALDVAHGQGVVHGDLKPANLLVAPGGVLKVTDFGVARLVRAPIGPDVERLAGATVGTPEYMAPEVLLGRVPDVRADLYAAGVVIHECLTGETPFHADTPVAFFARKLDDGRTEGRTPPYGTPIRPTLASSDDLAASLGGLVARMTDADAAKRPGSAREVYGMLAAMG